MRADMAKVIVERPRRGLRQNCAKGYKKAMNKLAPEEWHKRESIFALKGHTKFFNEHLGPLRRYLHKQVGRPWDKVLSEICKFIRLDSAVQSHVRDHLEDFVEIHVIERNGILCHGHGWFLGKPLNTGRWCQFYVCPRTGLLRRIKPRKQVSPKLPIESVPLDEWHEYRLMDGIWYLDGHFISP